MKPFLRLLFFFVISLPISAQQVPDFTMTDINGNSHSLYADYLDQGKTVFISAAATWNPWDETWIESGVLDEFHATYGSDAVVLFIEADPGTPESDLYGTGQSSTYDYVTGHDYTIIDDSEGIIQNQWGLSYYPSVFIICSDGTGYTADAGVAELMNDPDVFYGSFETALDIADKMYELCGTGFDRSKLNGITYIDSDLDCEEDGETGVPMMMVNIDGPNGSFYRITDEDGEFRTLADIGTYNVEVTPPANGLWDICDNPQSYTFLTDQDSTYMDFGLQANMSCTDPVVEISAPFLVRCFENGIYVNYCNNGTIAAEDVVVTVTLDSFLIVNGISQTPASQSGFTYTFDIGTLGVFECGDIVFDVEVDCEAELGTEQCYSAQISPEAGCENSLLSGVEECQEIVGSFDPNDKRAFPFQEGDEYVISPNEVIKYQIRFQNTGNFMAFKVEVVDSISALLDLSTFRMGTASHDYQVIVEDNRTLRFVFDGINLPDSTSNEAESHGFLTYYINQMPDLPDGIKIENTAGIYFDFNDPVITNTTIHTVDYNIVSNQEIENSIGFHVTPNPAKDYVQINIGDININQGVYSLTNVNGQVVQSGNFNNPVFDVELNDVPTGIYFIRLMDNLGNSGIKKVMIK